MQIYGILQNTLLYIGVTGSILNGYKQAANSCLLFLLRHTYRQ